MKKPISNIFGLSFNTHWFNTNYISSAHCLILYNVSSYPIHYVRLHTNKR
ncbi:hypothetical protein EST35_0017 [Pseudomonas phage vB_PaeM_PA5oct]|uniref:Uncharacterized protein n=1 Tax=Pseudomonas phage vB_PaeM_PA5oct TaxID=2163605 RepID=A0A4Y5JUQ2_9CAUD|nr:hypothetical protein PQE65_gp017 [Pseudomonas phage vB_PaeM_PA5oct]QCG75901.1 hypothetical protein EST35_0017 [Pseudomonas phage vB_PaeM_PA5oct]